MSRPDHVSGAFYPGPYRDDVSDRGDTQGPVGGYVDCFHRERL
jgi:hypothetical protein